MTDQQPTYDQAEDYGGSLATYSEFKPREQAAYLSGGQLRAGRVLHVSNGESGQIYIIANEETGFPDVVLASELRPIVL